MLRTQLFLKLAVLCTLFSSAGFAQPSQGVTTGTEQEKAQVLNLFQRIKSASENGDLATEGAVTKSLGFRFYIPGNYAYSANREIETGIAILDKSPTKEHVRYGEQRPPKFQWSLRIQKISQLVCIQRADIHASFGETPRVGPPPHVLGPQISTFTGVEYYELGTGEGQKVIYDFLYTIENNQECVENLIVGLQPRK